MWFFSHFVCSINRSVVVSKMVHSSGNSQMTFLILLNWFHYHQAAAIVEFCCSCYYCCCCCCYHWQNVYTRCGPSLIVNIHTYSMEKGVHKQWSNRSSFPISISIFFQINVPFSMCFEINTIGKFVCLRANAAMSHCHLHCFRCLDCEWKCPYDSMFKSIVMRCSINIYTNRCR